MGYKYRKNYTFSAGTFKSDYDLVRSEVDIVAKSGGSEVRYQLFKGLFSDLKEEFLNTATNKAVIINIDGDIYNSAVDALNIVNNRIQTGTVILFDDFNCFNASKNAGERKAFAEFCETTQFEFEKWFSYAYAGPAFLCVGTK